MKTFQPSAYSFFVGLLPTPAVSCDQPAGYLIETNAGFSNMNVASKASLGSQAGKFNTMGNRLERFTN